MEYLEQLNLAVMRKIKQKEMQREWYEKNQNTKHNSQSGLTSAIIFQGKEGEEGGNPTAVKILEEALEN